MSKFVPWLGLALLASAAVAQEEPMHHNMAIDCVGTASKRIPLDSIEIVFGLDMESDSFGAAKQAADAVFAKATSRGRDLGLPAFQDHYDFASLDQDFLSIGRRGSKLRHRLRLSSEGLAPERMLSAAVDLVDAVLAVDKRLWVISMTASLSSAGDAKAIENLLGEASADALAQARAMAAPLGQSVAAPLSLKGRCGNSDWRPMGSSAGVEEIIVTAQKRASVSTRKSFGVDRPFESEIERTCGVAARFAVKTP